MTGPRFRVTSPREVALAMLDARFGVPHATARDRGLAAFQQDALDRITEILRQRRGAVLADSVGLGKTHVAAALIRRVSAEGGAVLVSGPSVLQAHWRRHLRRVGHWRWCSHPSMSRGTVPAGDWRLVVIDEAHAFRNPATQRYRTLAAVCAGADVLLLTATPVNNTVLDCYHLLRLFADDAAFHDVGVPDMRAAFDAAARSSDARDVRRIAEHVVVRRTREMVRDSHGVDVHGLRFPDAAAVRTIPCDLSDAYDDAGGLLDMVMKLRFPAHSVTGDTTARALLRLGLLKRLESGASAFRASLERHARLLDAFVRALHDGYVLDARDYRALVGNETAELQLLLDATVLRRLTPDVDAARIVRNAMHDHALLRDVLARTARADNDPKLALLKRLLHGKLRGERVLIFTEFAETATAIWRALRDEHRCALIHGATARLGRNVSSRRAVIERFAPHANGVRAPPLRERVDVLVTTDVLAEGLNLQDARIVISYDLPWNPVRLAQRIGRIDRLGSPHARIEALAFVPDPRLDALLQLVRRLRRKLRAIRIVGGDAPVMSTSRRADGISGRSHSLTKAETARQAESEPASIVRGAASDQVKHDLEISERLRMRHRDAHRCVRPDEPGCIPVAALPSSDTHAAVLSCSRTDGRVRCRLLHTGGRVVEDEAGVDRILLEALDDGAAREPDLRRIRRALSIGEPDRPRPSGRTRRRGAALVRRWLGTIPLGPPRDLERADRLIREIAGAGAAVLSDIERALRSRGDIAQRIERLESVLAVATASHPGANARDTTAPAPRPIAALEMVPMHRAEALNVASTEVQHAPQNDFETRRKRLQNKA